MTLPQLQFGCGLVQAPFVTSSGILEKTWSVISSRDVPQEGNGLVWKVYEEVEGLMVVVFEVKPGFDLKPDLVSSSELKKDNFTLFEFLCNKKFPDFSVNSSAVSLFLQNLEGLNELKSRINSSSSPRLIVTGFGLGGAIASVFTLSLLDSIVTEKKHPLCITFDSPLVGDKKFQEAISRNSTWSSCFLHVVSLKDQLLTMLNPHTTDYMPFGTFLFCSDTSSTCFENPEFILELLVHSINDQNQNFQPIQYENILKILNLKAICKDILTKEEDLTHSNSLHAIISLQLQILGLTPHVQLIKTLESKIRPRRKTSDTSKKKLNKMKTNMAQLEWYKKYSKERNIGYYDSYRNMNLEQDHHAVTFQKKLTNYWEEMVEEAEMKLQKGVALSTSWLFGGNNYRRMVEPLAIAEYYREGGRDYVTKKRSKHFVQLEKWLKEETAKATSKSNNTDKKDVESIMTVDSCFWAHVEEALLLCQLHNAQKEEAAEKLLEFEKYVYGLLSKYEVSSEIFLMNSSYMKWWNEYKAIKGTSYNSALAVFMSNPDHYNVHYVKGTYNFLC